MPKINIKSITTKELYPLRESWLVEPGLIADPRFPGDGRSRAHHVGAVLQGTIIGIASVYNEPRPAMVEGRSWRLQGLAVMPRDRREGVGTSLVEAISRHVLRNKGNLIWANVPSDSCEFFAALKFEIAGDSFDVPGLGDHNRVLLHLKKR